MKETIVTIPINDLFGPKCGCPMCRMEAMLEEQYVEFITGDAMMEPSVRVETNRTGFCHRHFSKMNQSGKKLPNTLIMESHLQEISEKLMPKKIGGKPDKKQLEAIKAQLKSCYVCDRIDRDMHHLMETVFAEWQKGGEFRELYKAQQFICLKHYAFVMEAAMGRHGIPSKLIGDFHGDTAALTKNYLAELNKDVSHLAMMFDYRSRDADWGNSVDSVERSIEFLTGEKPFGYGSADGGSNQK